MCYARIYQQPYPSGNPANGANLSKILDIGFFPGNQ